jgi:hypothetical protein
VRPMTFHYATEVLWLTPLILQLLILFSLLRRKLIARYPLFFIYTGIIVCRELILFFLKKGNVYFLIYWWGETLAILLGLAVIFEILAHILPQSPSLRLVFKTMLIFGAMAAVAALLILVLAKPDRDSSLLEVIVMGERSVRFLQSSLLIVVIALMSRLGLSWHQESVGIAAGFGVYSALALVGFEFGGHLHVISTPTLALVNSAAYNLAAMIWAFYILRPVKVTQVKHLPSSDLAEWNSAVTDYVNQWSRRY